MAEAVAEFSFFEDPVAVFHREFEGDERRFRLARRERLVEIRAKLRFLLIVQGTVVGMGRESVIAQVASSIILEIKVHFVDTECLRAGICRCVRFIGMREGGYGRDVDGKGSKRELRERPHIDAELLGRSGEVIVDALFHPARDALGGIGVLRRIGRCDAGETILNKGAAYRGIFAAVRIGK